MALNFNRQLNGLQFVPQNTITPSVLGEVRYNSSTNKLELFDGIVDNIVTEAGSAPISNKTLVNDTVGSSSTNNLSNSLQFTELTSTPSSNPSSGILALYAKTDNNFYSLTSAGSEVLLTPQPIADATILSNINGSSALPSANTLSAIIDHDVDSTQGDILYRSASSWIALPPGSAGQFLATGGPAANPSWVPAAGSGTVTSVALTVPSFLSVTGSPITTSGTLAVSLSGTALPIPNGGTGQTTANASFAALSPLTTAGDLLSFTTVPVRVPIGTTGQVLTVSGGAPIWASSSAPTLHITAVTTTYTALTTDDVIECSGSSFTVTLYPASNSGKKLILKKTDASLTNIITIKGNASEDIGGFGNTVTMNTLDETWTLISTGTAWIVESHKTNTIEMFDTPIFSTGVVGAAISFTSSFLAGSSSITVSSATGLRIGMYLKDITTSSNFSSDTYITSISGTLIGLSHPTIANSAAGPGDTINTITSQWKAFREGKFLVANFKIDQINAGTTGSGDYKITVPFGLSMDTSQSIYQGIQPYDAQSTANMFGNVTIDTATGQFMMIGCFTAFDQTHIRIAGLQYDINGPTIALDYMAFWGTGTSIVFSNSLIKASGWLKVPIQGWYP